MAYAKVTMKMTDQLNNPVNENLGTINKQLYDGAAGRGTNANEVDTWVRAVAGLTTNTYIDSTITYEYSLTAIIEEEEG